MVHASKKLFFTGMGMLCISMISATDAQHNAAVLHGGWERTDAKTPEPDCCGLTFLKVYKLCADKIQAECIRAKYTALKYICSDSIGTDTLCGNLVQANNLAANNTQTMNLCSSDAQINTLNAGAIYADTLCLRGDFQFCTSFRALADDEIDQLLYVLGTPILFTTVVDDPNGDVTQGTYTSYAVPDSGYYMVDLVVNFNTLAGPVITGVPTAAPTILVNGAIARQTRQAFLSFSFRQTTNLSVLLKLNAGDILTFALDVYILDPSTGESTYPGTVTLTDGITNRTGFAIHYLSGTCSQTACPPSIPCAPTPVVCAACQDCPQNGTDCRDVYLDWE